MSKGKISFMTVLSIIGAYAAYGIGSGFATGQEILQYFASWGPKGMIAALLGSALLMGVAFSILVRDGFLHNDEFKKDSDCFAYYGGKYVGGFIDLFSIALVLGVYVEVFAGCGATINQYFGLPAFAGTIVMGIAVAIVVMLGLKRIVQILSCLGVIFIIYSVCFGIYCLAAGGSLAEAGAHLPQYIEEGKILQISILGLREPFWAGLNYGGVNLIVAVAFVLALGRGTKSRAEASVGGAGAGVVFMVPVVFSAIAILLNIDYIAVHGQQVPSLAAVNNMLPGLAKVYLVILVLGIFTTLTGYTWLITDRFAEEGTARSRIICAVVVVIGIFAGGILPFNAVINVLFPIAGLMGMFLTLLMVIKEIRIRTGRSGRKAVAALLMITMVFAAGCSGQSEEAEPNAASAEIADLTSDVTAANAADYDFTDKAMEYLEYIGTELPDRMIDGGRDHDAAREWIVSELRTAGYSDDQISLQEFNAEWLNGAKGTNIVLTIEGEDPSRQIIVGGHYDGDGVGDNGSGIALLLATAVGLQGMKPHYSVKIIFFDGEEEGCLGSEYNAEQMSDEEVAETLYMVNLDSLAFGDYCNIYGGTYGEMDMYSDEPQTEAPSATEAYTFAADTAESLGFKVMRTEDLDGYYAEHGTGPEIEDGTFYTNPWTPQNPAPANSYAMSPATLPASDHIYYMDRGIEYIYFEATNWFASTEDDDYGLSYTGYLETYDTSLGDHGMFMNTEFDTWDNLNELFPGRAEAHFRIYSPLLSALILVR